MERLLAGFDWSSRSRVVEAEHGLAGAVLVAGRSTSLGTVTQVSVACDGLDMRNALLRWGIDLSRAAGAVAAQMWCGRGRSEAMAQLGAAFVRPWWRMDIDLANHPPDPRPVPGYELRDGIGWPAAVRPRSTIDPSKTTGGSRPAIRLSW